MTLIINLSSLTKKDVAAGDYATQSRTTYVFPQLVLR